MQTNRPLFIKDFLKAVEKYRVTITSFVPSMGILLDRFQEYEKFNLKSLRYVTFSGAKTPRSTYKSLTEKYHHIKFINTYGMTEAGSRISIAAPLPSKFPAESVGRPMPNIKVRIVDKKQTILPPNEIGEVQVNSPYVMKGYYKQPQLTTETIVERWLKTGDLGKLDTNGNLFLAGRKKELIISGGQNIYPTEIEQCLLEHPAVLDAAVVTKEDELLQEVAAAFIVCRTCENLKSKDIIEFCKSRLSSYKIPRSVQFLDKLFIEYVSRLCLVQPGEGFNDVVLFPTIQFTTCCYMRKQQTICLIRIKGSRPFRIIEIRHHSSHRSVGSLSMSSSIMSDRISLFSFALRAWPSRLIV